MQVAILCFGCNLCMWQWLCLNELRAIPLQPFALLRCLVAALRTQLSL